MTRYDYEVVRIGEDFEVGRGGDWDVMHEEVEERGREYGALWDAIVEGHEFGSGMILNDFGHSAVEEVGEPFFVIDREICA